MAVLWANVSLTMAWTMMNLTSTLSTNRSTPTLLRPICYQDPVDEEEQMMEEKVDMIDEFLDIQDVVTVVVPILFGLIGILGLIGNSLVIIVVAANPGMRSTTNILIINLAVADLLFVVFCIPFTATDFVMSWPFGHVWCKVVQYLIIVTACASVYTLVLMSLDRYLAVVHPVASMSMRTESHAFIAICIVWIVILTSSIPVFMIHGECVIPTRDYNEMACRTVPDANRPLFQVTFFLMSYVIPLIFSSVLYIFMLQRLWRGARVSAESRRRKRVTRLIIVVVGVFAFCWFPIQVILVVKSLDKYPLSTASIMIQITSHVLAYTNSCVNPILYAFLSDNFRQAFRKVIYCKSRQDQHNRLGPLTRTTRTGSSGDIL